MTQTNNTNGTDRRAGTSRRTFLGGAAAAAAATGLTVVADPAGASASSSRGRRRRGSLDDVEHVVILMQENRSADHYYGTMRGVRGYGDRAALQLPGGHSVFAQPDPTRRDGAVLLPWHANTHKFDAQDLTGNDHSWGGVHTQWADGTNQGFVAETGEHTMAYFTDTDVPFNRALAQAFTLCDQYFCSIKGPTTPNRLFHWTGTIDPHGTAGGPAISNPADYQPVFSWTTYPERLQKAGVSWRVFANDEVGDGGGEDGYVGDYGDNPLWLFHAYHDALDSPDPKVRQLAERASVRKQWKPNSGKGHDIDHVLAEFLAACRSGRLPQVSWIVAPYAYSEHPAARPVDGAAYTQTVLDAIWAQPELWHNTVVLINYDEHDGFFDHVVSPTAPDGTPDEFVDGLPVGLGPRVPMTVVSPWSRGGWINSEVYDHTSVLRFLETWTGVREPNISQWRRELCGDLLGCFDFGRFDPSVPKLPDTRALRRQADRIESKLPEPTPPPPGQQRMPVQDPGRVPARALPYQPFANAMLGSGALQVDLGNDGSRAVQLQVYDLVTGAPGTRVDVGSCGRSKQTVAAVGRYDVAVQGPNGFLRRFTGTSDDVVNAVVRITGGTRDPELQLVLTNSSARPVEVVINGLDKHESSRRLHPGVTSMSVRPGDGWYDIVVRRKDDTSFVRRFAGHLEDGRPTVTG